MKVDEADIELLKRKLSETIIGFKLHKVDMVGFPPPPFSDFSSPNCD
jgi:hypothetical protein